MIITIAAAAAAAAISNIGSTSMFLNTRESFVIQSCSVMFCLIRRH